MSKNTEKSPKTPIADEYRRTMRQRAGWTAVRFREYAHDAASSSRIHARELAGLEKKLKAKNCVPTKYDTELVSTQKLLVAQLARHARDLKSFSTLIYNPEKKRFASEEDVTKAKHIDMGNALCKRLERLVINLRRKREGTLATIANKREKKAQAKREAQEKLRKEIGNKVGDFVRDALSAPGRMEQSEIPSGN